MTLTMMLTLHTGESGAYCGVFTVHGIIPLDSWERRTTPVCLTIEGSAVTDAYGNTFPDARQCSSYDHRCVVGWCMG